MDLIKRQDAIDALGERPLAWTQSEYETGLQNQYDSDVEAIQSVPSALIALEAQRWIPVRSGLPSNHQRVLVNIGINGRGASVRSGTYFDGWFHNDNGDTWHASDIGVIAWMPEPAPYGVPAPERDCEHCVHRKDKGCEKWDCEFERRQ